MLHLSCIFEIYIFIELIKEKQPYKIQSGIGLVNFVSLLNLEFLILNLSAAVYLIHRIHWFGFQNVPTFSFLGSQ